MIRLALYILFAMMAMFAMAVAAFWGIWHGLGDLRHPLSDLARGVFLGVTTSHLFRLWRGDVEFGGDLRGLFVAVKMSMSPEARAARQASIRASASRQICPSCGHNEYHYKTSGLWDGYHPSTRVRCHGSFVYAVCNNCSGRWAQWDDQPSYIPSDEEWSRQVASHDQGYLWAKGHDPLLDEAEYFRRSLAVGSPHSQT